MRSQRDWDRNETIKAKTGHLRKLILQQPGLETPFVAIGTSFDTTRKGLSSYDRNGLPIVVGARATQAFETIENLTGIALPIEIGQDKFITNSVVKSTDGSGNVFYSSTSAATTRDLFKDAQGLPTTSTDPKEVP
jgi:hypothetical protein